MELAAFWMRSPPTLPFWARSNGQIGTLARWTID